MTDGNVLQEMGGTSYINIFYQKCVQNAIAAGLLYSAAQYFLDEAMVFNDLHNQFIFRVHFVCMESNILPFVLNLTAINEIMGSSGRFSYLKAKVPLGVANPGQFPVPGSRPGLEAQSRDPGIPNL